MNLYFYRKRRFPPKTRLLSEDEYHEQGARETVKALDELRKYCSSPECNQWKTVLRLREPIRYKNRRCAIIILDFGGWWWVNFKILHLKFIFTH